jgi:hypothetical protein
VKVERERERDRETERNRQRYIEIERATVDTDAYIQTMRPKDTQALAYKRRTSILQVVHECTIHTHTHTHRQKTYRSFQLSLTRSSPLAEADFFKKPSFVTRLFNSDNAMMSTILYLGECGLCLGTRNVGATIMGSKDFYMQHQTDDYTENISIFIPCIFRL